MLTVRSANKITNMEILANLPDLRTLDLGDSFVTGFEFLKGLSSLRALDISVSGGIGTSFVYTGFR